MKTQMNCWDVMRCSNREECPAYPEKGRGCWEVTGTLCRNQQQGSYTEKIQFCRKSCDFYKGVIYGKM